MNRIIIAIRQRAFVFLMKNAKAIKNDKLYVFLYYLFGTGRVLKFKNPKRFSEKLQILKVTVNTDPHFGELVDKLKVRKIVSKLIGEKYLNVLYSKHKTAEDIDFNSLNYPCIIKTTHDSGGVFPLMKEPDQLTILEIRKRLNLKLSTNYFWKGRETPYKYATPMIICEKYLVDDKFDCPVDYKLFCFNGITKLIQVTSIEDKKQFVNYYDETLKPLDIKSGAYSKNKNYSLPPTVEEMILLAKKLSKSLCHVRVDFYSINNSIIFGEYTFHSDGGLLKFNDKSFDFKLGAQIECC